MTNKKIKLIIIGIIVFIVLIFFAQQFITTTNKKTKAAVDRAQVTFILDPKHDFLAEEEFVLGVRTSATAGKKISAVDLYIKYDADNKDVLDYMRIDSYVPATYFDDVVIETKPVPLVLGAKVLHLVLVAKKSDDQLINSAQINIRFKIRKTTNEVYNTTQFSLASNSQIVGTADGGVYEIDASSSDVINQLKSCIDATECGVNTACTSGACVCNTGFYSCDINWANGCESNAVCTDTLPPGGSGITLNLKLRFQGILKLPAANLRTMQVKVKMTNGSANLTPQIGTFTATEETAANGDKKVVWNGTVSFPNNAPASGYAIYIKGPKQIQKKICDVLPSDGAKVGSYRCEIGRAVPLAASNTLDFSNIWLLSGDLPDQDGIVDSYDGSLIRNNLGKTDEPRCDINLDGVCDSQDWSLLIQSLSMKYDEE